MRIWRTSVRHWDPCRESLTGLLQRIFKVIRKISGRKVNRCEDDWHLAIYKSKSKQMECQNSHENHVIIWQIIILGLQERRFTTGKNSERLVFMLQLSKTLVSRTLCWNLDIFLNAAVIFFVVGFNSTMALCMPQLAPSQVGHLIGRLLPACGPGKLPSWNVA